MLNLRIKLKPFSTKTTPQKLINPMANLVYRETLVPSYFDGNIGHTPLLGSEYIMVFHAEKHRPKIVYAAKDNPKRGIKKGQRVAVKEGFWKYTYYKIPAELLKFITVKQHKRHFTITSKK